MNCFNKCDISLAPEDAWDFFQEHKSLFTSKTVEIAENKDTGYSVYMTEFGGTPYFMVYKDSKILYTENAISSRSCVKVLNNIYLTYLLPVEEKISKSAYSDEERSEEQEELVELDDIISEREDELYFAMRDFLCVLLNCTEESLINYYGEDIIEDLIDKTCIAMANDYSISIYRPVWAGGDIESGTFVEYPYLDRSEP